MDRENTISLTVMIIIMAVFAIFIGYLLGNWVIQWVTGGTPETHQVTEDDSYQNEITREEIVEDEESKEQVEDSITSGSNTNLVENQLQGDVYVVQVGAFKSRQNAENLQQELEQKGYQPIITEGIPYKVQLGATNDIKEAKELEKEIEEKGYDAFVAH